MTGLTSVALLEQHRTLVAHAIARQIMHTVPKYRHVDEVQLAANVDAVLEGVLCLLVRRDVASVTRVIDLLVALHNSRGFAPADYVVAVLCGLPVLRRFYFHYASSRALGVELYEQVESIVLPLYGHLVMRLSGGFDEPEATDTDVTAPLDRDDLDPEEAALPFEIVSVEQVLQLKAEQSRIRQERDRLARELEELRRVVDRSAQLRAEQRGGNSGSQVERRRPRSLHE